MGRQYTISPEALARRAFIGAFPWTEARLEILRRMHAEDAPFSEIGAVLGCTRNACIGKARRIGLPPRLGMTNNPNGTQGPRTVKKQSFSAQVPKIKKQKRQMSKLVDLYEAINRDDIKDIPHDQSSFAVSLFDVQDHQCRWPLNDAGEGFLFCGATKWKDCSYCARHYNMAWRSQLDITEADRIRRSMQIKKINRTDPVCRPLDDAA